MLVGYMGNIPFITSRRYLMTIDDYERNSEGRWAQHDIVGQKPVLEFLGPDLENITMKISLRRDHGVNPESILSQLRQMRDTGEAFTLVDGIVKLGVCVTHFPAVDEQFETLNIIRLVRLLLRKRGDLDRVVDDEGRLKKMLFHIVFKDQA